MDDTFEYKMDVGHYLNRIRFLQGENNVVQVSSLKRQRFSNRNQFSNVHPHNSWTKMTHFSWKTYYNNTSKTFLKYHQLLWGLKF